MKVAYLIVDWLFTTDQFLVQIQGMYVNGDSSVILPAFAFDYQQLDYPRDNRRS